MSVLFLDIETTGINPLSDQIVLIGVKELDKPPYTFFTGSETDILKDFHNYLLKEVSPETHIICGWKIERFDLRFIRARSLVNNIPELIHTLHNYKILDLASIVDRYLILPDQTSKSSEVLNAFKIEKNDTITGKDVPSLYKVGKIGEIVIHNYYDIKVTEKLFHKLRPLLKLDGWEV